MPYEDPWILLLSICNFPGFGGSPFPFPLTQPFSGDVWWASLQIPSGCRVHTFPLSLSLSEDSRFRVFPRTWPPPPELRGRIHVEGGVLGCGEQGHLKKTVFCFPCWCGVLTEKWCCCLGAEPWGTEGAGPCLCLWMARTFWWIGVWYSVTSCGWWFKEKAFSFCVLFSRVF